MLINNNWPNSFFFVTFMWCDSVAYLILLIQVKQITRIKWRKKCDPVVVEETCIELNITWIKSCFMHDITYDAWENEALRSIFWSLCLSICGVESCFNFTSTVMGLCCSFAELDGDFVIAWMKTNDKQPLKTACSVATFLLVLCSSSSRASSCACCECDYTQKLWQTICGNCARLSPLQRRREQTQLHCGFKRDVSNWQLAPPQCFRQRLVKSSSPVRLFSLLAWDW